MYHGWEEVVINYIKFKIIQMNKIKCTILEFNKGTYEGNEYANIVARYNDKLVKFRVDVKKVSNLSSEDVDKEVECELEIHGSASQPASVKISSVEFL